jgi:hypothetical protein
MRMRRRRSFLLIVSASFIVHISISGLSGPGSTSLEIKWKVRQIRENRSLKQKRRKKIDQQVLIDTNYTSKRFPSLRGLDNEKLK